MFTATKITILNKVQKSSLLVLSYRLVFKKKSMHLLKILE